MLAANYLLLALVVFYLRRSRRVFWPLPMWQDALVALTFPVSLLMLLVLREGRAYREVLK